VSGGRVTHAGYALRQERAALALAEIIGDCRGLPLLTWTVIPAGSVLHGKVTGPAPAGQVRATVAAWREALGLEDYREWPGGRGTTRLHAAGQRGDVRVRISASLFEEEG
jgi:hypothetical protein